MVRNKTESETQELILHSKLTNKLEIYIEI